ncbi:MmcQ/YjbR family DNA-binding protein [Pontibacter sp. G13]|uniref:MmcQ/YjbR family DNA-binding protein n=1 Tax=Pontibacter sp. G13 TaxID=3074898 RepID=UPI002889F05A|nr:MmcQ/YjbR family DNA-binding protein [Pontibacter sp. G13]WNJ18229.1 MmcQ/YjbR family DNA-binding protein [Pontibacter sp. G13]
MSYCRSLPGAEETYPHGDHAVWFKVGDKGFAMTFVLPFTYEGSEAPPFHFLNLKCDPDHAISLRESHDAIIPGWHMNKKHWNSVFMDGSLTDDFIESMIKDSYQLVFQSLPKRLQNELSQTTSS